MQTLRPTLEEFREKARRGNLVPVYREILADLETPVSAFRKFDDAEYAFLLESVEQGGFVGRYSFIGSHPKILFKSKGNEVQILYQPDEEDFRTTTAPLDELRQFMSRYHPVDDDPALPPFTGGAVGYISYDAIRTLERLPDANPDDLRLPDCFFMIAESLVVFDHVRRRMILLANAHIRDSVDAAYEEAVHRIEVMADKLARPLSREWQSNRKGGNGSPGLAPFQSNFSREDYEAGVRRCIEYIQAGDAFQIVLSQRFQRPIQCNAFDVYRALRATNPSPYNFYLKLGDLRLIGSSPEVLCRVRGSKVGIRPIAGTRPRGQSEAEDLQLEKDLLGDPKERAEHIMLVDLGRNDVGRVATYGSVHVEDLMVVERYSHVMHIVSSVAGELREGANGFDAVKATFPHGTVSGAPKIRAMEIIDELENVRRGPYAGCVGYFAFNGNVDTCITIRTIVIKDNLGSVQAGGGIVADSDPATEWQETVNKASAVFRAVELAEAGLDP